MAGSFVAGVDDGSALYYNPAGLASIEGSTALVDFGIVLQRVGYDRVDSGGNPQPHVNGDMDVLPIPTVAVTWKPRTLPRLTIAGGVWTPYLGVNSWRENGPQRYSDVTLNGSLLAVPEIAAAYRVTDSLSVGVGLQDMIVRFRSRVVLSGCTELNCAPEDPSFDALSEVKTTTAFTPSAIVGATYATGAIRMGLAVQLPFYVRSSGTVRSRLPTDPQFANAMQNGDEVALDFDLPLEIRLAAQARPLPDLAVELGVDYEAWQMQKDLRIVPKGITIEGVPGIGKYDLRPVSVKRDLRGTFSVHAGGEWKLLAGKVIARAGYLMETSATPDRTATVLAPDGFHNLITVGAGVPVGTLRFDIGYGHLFTSDRNVTASESLQLNPIQPSLAVPVGNGRYTVATDIVSAGVAGRF